MINTKSSSLRRRHRNLDDRISEEQRKLVPNTILLRSLKREKLRIKDAIAFG